MRELGYSVKTYEVGHRPLKGKTMLKRLDHNGICCEDDAGDGCWLGGKIGLGGSGFPTADPSRVYTILGND